MNPTPNSLTAILTDPNLVADQAPLDPSFQLYAGARNSSSSRALSLERRSITYQFEFEEKPSYIVVGLYDDNAPAELLVHAPHATNDVSDLVNVVGSLVTASLQNYIDLATVVEILSASRHELTQSVATFLRDRFLTSVVPSLDSLSKPVVVELADKEAKE